MGRKRNIQRYKNIICTACCLILILLFTGCQYNYYPKLSIKTVEGENGRIHLEKAEEHVDKGNFKAAFDENKKAHDFFPPELKQEAVFQKALIYLHPANPDMNFEKAMACFNLIDKEPDDSIQAYNSQLILPVLKESCGLAKNASTNNRNIQKNRKKMNQLIKEQKKLKKYIAKLRQQIKQLKEIDLSSNMEIKGGLNE